MSTVVTYFRSATDDPASLSPRQAELDAWLAEHPEHQLVGAFSDVPCLRSTPLRRRPGFSALVALVEERKVELVVYPDSCVIGSDINERMEIGEWLDARGVALSSTKAVFDYKEARRFQEVLVKMINEFVLDQKRQSAAHARACKVQKRALRLQTA